MRGRAAITAIGMVSSLGHDAITACAAARAGLVQTDVLASMDFGGEALFGVETIEGPPQVIGHPVAQLADGFRGAAKVLVLGAAALLDLQSRRRLTERQLAETHLYLVLSDHHVRDVHERRQRERGQGQDAAGYLDSGELPSERWARQSANLALRIVKSAGLPIADARCYLRLSGRAGFGAALGEAVARIDAGAERCLVGAVDSRLDPDFLTAAAAVGLLKTNANPVGFLPGEAAAFVLLEQNRRDALAVLHTPAVVDDDTSLLDEAPPVGRALSEALRGALRAGGTAPSWLLADLNGTSRRALEWGHALVRVQPELGLAELPLWLPVESFGEAGAAVGALGVCIATRALSHGYAPGPAALLTLSSERGQKAALLIERA